MVCAMSGSGFSDVRRFDSIDSTNRYLVDEAAAGAAEGTVAVASHQSAGRGRLGRRWEAPPGACLLVSVLLRPALPPDDLHWCTSLVALAGIDACRDVAGVEPQLKWPNDLVVADRKLAGVLAEVVTGPGGPGSPGRLVRPERPGVVVGIGINVAWEGPPGAGGTSLRAEGAPMVDIDDLLGAFLDALGRRRPALDGPDGLAALLTEVRRRCRTLGQEVRVELANESITGTASDIDRHGHLLLATVNGTEAVSAGDVVHLRPAGSAPVAGEAGGGTAAAPPGGSR